MPRKIKSKSIGFTILGLTILGVTIGIVTYMTIPFEEKPKIIQDLEGIFLEPEVIEKDPLILDINEFQPEFYSPFILTGGNSYLLGGSLWFDLSTNNETEIAERFYINENLTWSNGSAKIFVLNYTKQIGPELISNQWFALTRILISTERPDGDWIYFETINRPMNATLAAAETIKPFRI